MKWSDLLTGAIGAIGIILLVGMFVPITVESPPPVDGGLIEPASLAAALDTPCPTEDSQNCYWDADAAGNGSGESFLTVEGHIFPLTALVSD